MRHIVSDEAVNFGDLELKHSRDIQLNVVIYVNSNVFTPYLAFRLKILQNLVTMFGKAKKKYNVAALECRFTGKT